MNGHANKNAALNKEKHKTRDFEYTTVRSRSEDAMQTNKAGFRAALAKQDKLKIRAGS